MIGLSGLSEDNCFVQNLLIQDNMQPSVQSPKESKSVRSVRVVQVDTPDQDVASGLSAPGSPCGCKPCRPSRTQSYKSATGTWPAKTDHEILRENVTDKVEVEDIASGLSARGLPCGPGISNELKVHTTKPSQSRLQSYKLANAMRSATGDHEIPRESQTAKIKVVVRKRPINKKEVSRNEEDIIQVAKHGCLLTVDELKLKVDLTAYVEKHEFSFDAILDENVNNDEVYLETVEPIIPTLFQQTKATCFAYGQTGSGKTFTMQPLPLKASQDIFHLMQQPSYIDQGFELWISYFEIYGGKLFDLLNDRRKLCMREDGRQQVCIVGLKEFQIYDLDTLKDYIERGSCSRSTGSTGANEESSRSHAILQLSIKRAFDIKEKRRPQIIGKLSFIDLAGNERGADTTDNDRQTRLEGAEINKSLLALKECIRALDSDQSHIPFRGSKLTEVLRDSFVGNSRTVMISCISPSSGCCEHTLNTLRYADRVKGLSKNSNSKRDFSSLSSQSESCTSPPQSHVEHLSNKGEEPHKSELKLLPSRPHTASGQMNGQYDWKQPLPAKDRFNANGLDYRQQESKPWLPTKKRTNDEQIDLRSEEAQKQEGTSSYSLKPSSLVHDLKQHSPSKDRFNVQQNIKPRLPLRNSTKEEQMDTQCEEVHNQEGAINYLPKPNFVAQGNMDIGPADPMGKVSALSKEEDYLVAAHCKELEGTIAFVREEMRLLVEVDQPGSQINRYVSQLSKLLSKKAKGLTDLQARVARFQQLMQDQESLGLQPA